MKFMLQPHMSLKLKKKLLGSLQTVRRMLSYSMAHGTHENLVILTPVREIALLILERRIMFMSNWGFLRIYRLVLYWEMTICLFLEAIGAITHNIGNLAWLKPS